MHRVSHEEGPAHSSHKDKLKQVQHFARTLAPPVGSQEVPHSDDVGQFRMPNYPQNYYGSEDDATFGRDSAYTKEFDSIPHNPPKEYHIHQKPHHKHTGKHQKEAKTEEVAFVGEEEADRVVDPKAEKPESQGEKSQVSQPKEAEPNIHGKASAVKNVADDRHGNIRNVASMADMYFLGELSGHVMMLSIICLFLLHILCETLMLLLLCCRYLFDPSVIFVFLNLVGSCRSVSQCICMMKTFSLHLS